MDVVCHMRMGQAVLRLWSCRHQPMPQWRRCMKNERYEQTVTAFLIIVVQQTITTIIAQHHWIAVTN